MTVSAEPSQLAWISAGMCALGVGSLEPAAGFALWQPLQWAVTLQFGDARQTLRVEIAGAARQRWFLGSAVYDVQRDGGEWRAGGQPVPRAHRVGQQVTVFENYGQVFTLEDPLQQGGGPSGDADCVEAPMPGLVREMLAQAGQVVAKGDRLAVLEAMKMEHALLAPRDGVVAEVLAQAGAQVEAGAALVQLEKGEKEAS